MTIQDAIKACFTRGDKFGRPVSWRGTGAAIDLARRMYKADKVRRFTILREDILLGSDWDVDPAEFLMDWETVTREDLANEVCQKSESDV